MIGYGRQEIRGDMRSRGGTSRSPAAGPRRWFHRWWLARSVRAKGLIVVAVPLIALVAVTSAGLVLEHSERQQRKIALAASALSAAAGQVLAQAINAETGLRGYAVTRDPLFLQPYNLGLAAINADLGLLRSTARQEGVSRQAQQITSTTNEVLDQLAVLRLEVRNGSSIYALIPGLEAQKMTMDLLRRQVARIAAGPLALALPRRASITRLEQADEVVDIAGLVLGLLAGLAGVALFTSGISRRVTAAAANADLLGEGRPLEPVEPSADDLGHLADSLIRAGGLLAGRAAERDRPRLALLAAIVDSSDDAIVSSSVDGLITSWNPGAERIYGYSADEAVGQDTGLVLQADVRGEEAAVLSALVARDGRQSGVGSLQRDAVQQRKDGTSVPVSVMLSTIRDDKGTLIGTSSIGRDITEPLRAAAELRSRMDDLERANQNLETFTYSVSHDLRAPLRSMAGFSAALVEDCADELGADGLDYVARIQAASARMAALIEDLLHLSRLWRTELQNVQPVDLSAEVSRIVGDLRLGTPDRTVRVTVQDHVLAPADPVLIRSVLENLVGNAWKFTSRRDDASIEFGTRPTKDAAVTYFVRDNGAGFDPAYADKLFAPFERLHATSEFPGTGVGLASVRQIVERHGGQVWAEGAVGAGATFSFTLNAKDTS
jgi:PAS domain S-box-containing protein